MRNIPLIGGTGFFGRALLSKPSHGTALFITVRTTGMEETLFARLAKRLQRADGIGQIHELCGPQQVTLAERIRYASVTAANTGLPFQRIATPLEAVAARYLGQSG